MAPEPSPSTGTHTLTMYMRHDTCSLVVPGLVGGFAARDAGVSGVWLRAALARPLRALHWRADGLVLHASALGRDPPRGSNQDDLIPLAVEFCRCCRRAVAWDTAALRMPAGCVVAGQAALASAHTGCAPSLPPMVTLPPREV